MAAALQRFHADTVMPRLHFVRRMAAGFRAMAQRGLGSTPELGALIADAQRFQPLFPSS